MNWETKTKKELVKELKGRISFIKSQVPKIEEVKHKIMLLENRNERLMEEAVELRNRLKVGEAVARNLVAYVFHGTDLTRPASRCLHDHPNLNALKAKKES